MAERSGEVSLGPLPCSTGLEGNDGGWPGVERVKREGSLSTVLVLKLPRPKSSGVPGGKHHVTSMVPRSA